MITAPVSKYASTGSPTPVRADASTAQTEYR